MCTLPVSVKTSIENSFMGKECLVERSIEGNCTRKRWYPIDYGQ